MLFTVTLIASHFVATPVVLTSQVVSATIFKPGLVLVSREVAVPAGLGLYALDRVPQALDGTLWYSSPDAAQISELKTSLNLAATTKLKEATSIPEVLAANLGKVINLTVKGEKARETVTGKLIGYLPSANTLTLRLMNGHMRSVELGGIVDVDLAGLKTNLSHSAPALSLQFRANASKPSRVRFIDLEVGAAWVANYRLDLHGETAHIQSMAEMGLGALKLDNVRVRLATGLPMMDSATKLDLATGLTSLKGYLDGERPFDFGKERDPYDSLVRAMRNAYGNLRGGDGLVAEGIDFISYDPSDNSLVVKDGPETPRVLATAMLASRLEDIQLYELGSVSLPAGGRLTRILSDGESPSKTVYRWTVTPNAPNNPFLRTLKLHNNTKNSWPAGSVFILSDEVPLARLPMAMTPSGQDASLDMGTSEDLLRDYENEVLARKEVVLQREIKGLEVTNETTLTVTNTKPEGVEVEIVFNLTGEVISAIDGTTSVKKMSNSLNPESFVTYRATLKAGEERKFVCQYKEVVR